MFKKNIYYFVVLILILILFLPFFYKIFNNFPFKDVRNFIEYLNSGTKGEELLTSFSYTLIFMITSVAGQLILGVYAAYITFFSSKPKLYIFIFFLPYITPLFVSTLSTRLGFEINGYMTNLIKSIFSQSFTPLNNKYFHLLIITLLSIWQYFPFVFIFSYTMMKRINNVFILTSITDGANNNIIFRRILLPNIAKIVFPLLMLRLLFMFNKYNILVLFAKSDYPNQSTIRLLPIHLSQLLNSTNVVTNNYGLIIVFITMVFFLLFWFILRYVFNFIIRKI